MCVLSVNMCSVLSLAFSAFGKKMNFFRSANIRICLKPLGDRFHLFFHTFIGSFSSVNLAGSNKKKAPAPPPPGVKRGHMRAPSDPGFGTKIHLRRPSDPPPLPLKMMTLPPGSYWHYIIICNLGDNKLCCFSFCKK